MARPLYLGTDVLQRARDLEFRQRADRDIWKLTRSVEWDDDITGLSKLIEPPQLELQAAPEQEPLPIVVSDRPDAMALQRQAQERQAPQQPMAQPVQQQAPAASGAPMAMPVASDPEGQRMPTSERAANVPAAGGEYRAYARQMAQAYGLDPDIFERQINQESGFQPWGADGRPLGSSAGAQGIAQFMPGTAAQYGVDVNDPYSSLEGAARHMRDLLRANNGNYRMALAAYNAGQGNVDKYGEGVFGDDFAHGETKRYVTNILGGGAPVMPRLSLNAAQPSAPGSAAPPAPGGVSSAPPGAPPAPWEMAGAQDGGQAFMKAEGQDEYDPRLYDEGPRELAPTPVNDAMLPGDGGFAPTPEYDPRAVDEGQRESRPAPILPTDPTVSDPAYTQSPTGLTYGPIQQGDMQGPPAPAQTQMDRYVPTYQAQAAQVAPTRPTPAAGAVQAGIDAAVESYNDPFYQAGPQPPRWVKIVSDAMQAFGAESAKNVARSLGVTDEEWFNVFGYPISRVDVAGFAGGVLADPTNYVGMNMADPMLTVARGAVRDFAPQAVQNVGRAVGSTLHEGAEAVGRGLQGVGREVAGGLMDLNPAMTPRIIGDGPGIGRAMADGAGQAPEAAAPPSRRFYHGTAGAFERPAPEAMSASGMYGPGYYLTPDPDVAGRYAEIRSYPDQRSVESMQAQLERVRAQMADPSVPESLRPGLQAAETNLTQRIANESARSGPNVRAVDVPSDVNLFNNEGRVSRGKIRRIERAASSVTGSRFRFEPYALESGAGIRTALYEELGDWGEVNRVLHAAGFDGIQARSATPGQGGLGGDEVVIFPESLTKIRNAFSGEVGGGVVGPSPGPRGAGIGTQLATDAGNALAGSMVGAVAPADTPEERLRNTALGAAGFPVAGRLMRRAGGALGTPGVAPNRVAEAATPREPAPVFYSQLRRTLEDKMPNRANAQQIEGILKGSAVKPDEITWTGLDDFLRQNRGRPLTKQEVLEFLDQNAVTVEEVVKGQPLPKFVDPNIKAWEDWARRKHPDASDVRVQDVRTSETQPAYDVYVDGRRVVQGGTGEYVPRPKPDTKYAQYTLPGGENYRELLITRPDTSGYAVVEHPEQPGKWAIRTPDGDYIRGEEGARNAGQIKVWDKREYAESAGLATHRQNAYRSSHWAEPNVLAHVRFNERVAPDGKRVLLIEEIQSDWHQAGRKQGYNATELPPGYRVEPDTDTRGGAMFTVRDPDGNFVTGHSTEAQAVKDALSRLNQNTVPTAPYEKTWSELAMKRIIRWAAENGFDRIAWTPGEIHAPKRWGTERITWEKAPGGYRVTVEPQVGGNAGGVDLEGEAAARGIIQQGRPVLVTTLDDLKALLRDTPGLEAPGAREIAENRTLADQAWKRMQAAEAGIYRPRAEGMAGFYDQMLPTTAQKLGKKFGARVGTSEIDAGTGLGKDLRITQDEDGYFWFGRGGRREQGPFRERAWAEMGMEDEAARHPSQMQPVHSMDITPEMRESVVYQGQPQFAALPFDPASAAMGGAAGAMSEGEDGEAGDPLRTLAGMGFAGVAGRMARRNLGPGKTFALGLRPGERFDFDVKVVPLRSLITSHADNLGINPAFPRELQPRVRERAASRVQIERIMQSLDPDHLLLDSRRIDSGPMIVGPDMVVESGNGRSIALRRLANENPEGYREYLDALRESLPDYGLTEDALKGIDQPVLVRVRTTPLDPEARARFAAEANVGAQAEMSPIERAVQDAGRLSDDAVMRLAVGENQSVDQALLSPDNDAIRRAYLASIPESERPALLDAAGNLNSLGLERLKSALLVKTYRGSAGLRLATAFVESTDPGVRNVEQGIYSSLPAVSRAEAMITAGERDAGLSIASDVATAADVYARLRRAGVSVTDYLAQGALFGERETTPLQDRILSYLHNNARSSRRIRSMLDEYARTVEMQASPDQVDMFGGEVARASKEEVLDGVLRGLGADAGAVDGPDLGRTGAGSQVVEGTGAGPSPVQQPGAGAAPSGSAGSDAGTAAGPQLTPDEQLARSNAARGTGPQPLRPANLPPVADDLIPSTGGEAGALQVEGAPRPMQRPDPVGDILPSTGGPEGTLQQPGAPTPLARPTPIPRDVLPATGGEAGTLAQGGAPVPFARPGALPADAVPATGGPEGRLRVQEDRQAVEQLMADSAGARRYDDQQRRQISDATARYAEDVRTLSERIAGERAAGNTPDRLMAERAAVASRLHATMLLAEGRRGAAARAFREADRQSALLQRDPKRAVDQMHKRFGGQENAAAAADEYTRMVEDGATPVQLAKFWAGVERGKITGADLFALFRRFNMLSGPRTIEVNALSGALNFGYEVLSQAGGQLVRGRGAEAAAEMAAPFKAMGRAFGNLAETMRHGVSAEQAARGDIPRTLSSRTDNRAAKGVLAAMEMPDRFNAAVDQFYRTMTEDWAATTLAHKRARADGLSPRSEKWADAVAKHLQDIRDDPDVLPEIKAMADHVTFSEEPGGIGRGLEEFRRRAPLVANVLFPFIRTPYNIASRAVDLSPLGVVRTGAEVLTGRGRGRENVSRRVRDNALGLAAAYWAYDQAQQGNITGAGPDDPEKQAMLRATGWQPYSIKVGGEYWSYANFAPFSLALSMGAAAHETKQYAKPGESDTLALLGDAATRTAKVVTDMTVLQGIGAVIKSIQDPDRYGGAWLTQFIGSLVPAGSLLNTIGQATDDTVRRSERDTFANQVGQGVQARIPGLRQQVPAAQDPLGRAVPNDQQGAGALNPFRPTDARPDPAIQAFLDAGVDIGRPKDKVTVAPGVAPIELTPAEQRRWNELRGAILAQNVPNVAGSQRYQEAEKLARAKGLQTMLNAAAQAADKQLIAEIGGAEITRRVRTAVEKRRAS